MMVSTTSEQVENDRKCLCETSSIELYLTIRGRDAVNKYGN